MGITAASKRPVSLTNDYFTAPYYVVDAQVSYERGPWKTVLSVSNLTDNSYIFLRNASPALGTFGIYNEPRTYGLEARVRF